MLIPNFVFFIVISFFIFLYNRSAFIPFGTMDVDYVKPS
ncbi:hypothetical protein NT05LI_3529 [Listeria ivanovii FSL F6-596]|nr:hypothetical protein NT05LI_3529 [Listeria ivanovii FSL F6-596]